MQFRILTVNIFRCVKCITWLVTRPVFNSYGEICFCFVAVVLDNTAVNIPEKLMLLLWGISLTSFRWYLTEARLLQCARAGPLSYQCSVIYIFSLLY